MKIRKSIGYAFPTSTRACQLGHDDTGCYFIMLSVLREDGTWSPPYASPGSEGEATPDKDCPHLAELFKQTDGEVCPLWLKYR